MDRDQNDIGTETSGPKRRDRNVGTETPGLKWRERNHIYPSRYLNRKIIGNLSQRF